MPTAGDSLDMADFNGDGNPDLIMSEMFGDAVDVELGRGDGSFAAGPDASPPGGSETSHAIGDFNEDGRLDLAEANTRFLRIRVGNGQGAFGPTTAKLRCPSIWWQAAADFDHDGHLDLAAATRSDIVRVAWGDGTGALSRTPRTKLVVAGEVDHLPAADVNGDGRSDLAVVSTRPRASVSRLTVFLGCRRR